MSLFKRTIILCVDTGACNGGKLSAGRGGAGWEDDARDAAACFRILGGVRPHGGGEMKPYRYFQTLV